MKKLAYDQGLKGFESFEYKSVVGKKNICNERSVHTEEKIVYFNLVGCWNT